MTSRPIAAVLLALALATSPSWAAEKELDGDEIKAAFSKHRLYFEGKTPRGSATTVQIDFRADGGLRASNNFGFSDTGRWWIKNDTLCRKFAVWSRRATNCFRIWKDGENVRLVDKDLTIIGRLVK